MCHSFTKKDKNLSKFRWLYSFRRSRKCWTCLFGQRKYKTLFNKYITQKTYTLVAHYGHLKVWRKREQRESKKRERSAGGDRKEWETDTQGDMQRGEYGGRGLNGWRLLSIMWHLPGTYMWMWHSFCFQKTLSSD